MGTVRQQAGSYKCKTHLSLVGDKPAGECSPAVMNVHWHDSPADWLLKKSQEKIDSCQAWLLSLEVAVHLSRPLGFA
jgi:hypothetical protein